MINKTTLTLYEDGYYESYKNKQSLYSLLVLDDNIH